MTTRRRIVFAALLGVALTGAALAQPTKLPVAPPPTPLTDPPRAVPMADPTVPNMKLKDVLTIPKATATGTPAPAPKMPRITLKGRVVGKERPPLAIIEVDAKVYIVSAGTSMILDATTSLKVLEISATEVRIEVPMVKETVILN